MQFTQNENDQYRNFLHWISRYYGKAKWRVFVVKSSVFECRICRKSRTGRRRVREEILLSRDFYRLWLRAKYCGVRSMMFFLRPGLYVLVMSMNFDEEYRIRMLGCPHWTKSHWSRRVNVHEQKKYFPCFVNCQKTRKQELQQIAVWWTFCS